MSRHPSDNCHCQSLVWDNLPDCASILAPLAPSIDQCSIQIAGQERATLFLFREALAGMVEVHFRVEPDDATFIAIGRTIRAHQRACREGGNFL